MISHPLTYQGRPIDHNTTIKKYYGLVKQWLKEDVRFKNHYDLQCNTLEWLDAYKDQLIKGINDKINNGNVDTDYKNACVTIAIVHKHLSGADIWQEDVPDLVTRMGEPSYLLETGLP